MVLSRCLEVFRDMFELLQSNTDSSDVLDGCPAVHVSDSVKVSSFFLHVSQYISSAATYISGCLYLPLSTVSLPCWHEAENIELRCSNMECPRTLTEQVVENYPDGGMQVCIVTLGHAPLICVTYSFGLRMFTAPTGLFVVLPVRMDPATACQMMVSSDFYMIKGRSLMLHLIWLSNSANGNRHSYMPTTVAFEMQNQSSM